MLDCVKDSLARNGFSLFVIAAIMGILGGIAAAAGGPAIVLGPISLGVYSSAILAGLLVFGIIIAAGVLVIVIGCALGATALGVDEDPPPVSGSGEPNITQPVTSDEDDDTQDDAPPDPPPSKPKPDPEPEPPEGSPANPVGGGIGGKPGKDGGRD